MESDLIKINRWLLPFSWIYGGVTAIRNWMFDTEILKSEAYPIPIIGVGNITVGGTGKTPHVEYLIRLLQPQYKVAVLSRGYKRKTRGYLLATPQSTMKEVGDEPWQVKQKFPDVYVAVDSNRRRGIKRLLNDEATRDVQVILLDDAFQHRYVKPGLNIMLTDYYRLVTDDALLPAGRLRESASGRKRSQITIVTKCPSDISPMNQRVIQNALALRPYQSLYFSTFGYGEMMGIFNGKTRSLHSIEAEEHILLLTGIASPEQMRIDLSKHTRHIKPISFPDHHFFTEDDAKRIEEAYHELPAPRLIITTEKDVSRLRMCESLSEVIKRNIYAVPIQVEIMKDQQDTFNEEILGYVRKDSRNSSMAESKN